MHRRVMTALGMAAIGGLLAMALTGCAQAATEATPPMEDESIFDDSVTISDPVEPEPEPEPEPETVVVPDLYPIFYEMPDMSYTTEFSEIEAYLNDQISDTGLTVQAMTWDYDPGDPSAPAPAQDPAPGTEVPVGTVIEFEVALPE